MYMSIHVHVYLYLYLYIHRYRYRYIYLNIYLSISISTSIYGDREREYGLSLSLFRRYPELKLKNRLDTIKLQYNEGIGGCFPMHYDTSFNHSHREITALIYLNPVWKEGDGGELRLFPFPLASVDVAPVNDLLAVFNSTEMLHRVMPAMAPRVCLSMWFSRDEGTSPLSLPLRLSPLLNLDPANVDMLSFLLQPSNRKLFSKVRRFVLSSSADCNHIGV